MTKEHTSNINICVVIPTYKCKAHILNVIKKMSPLPSKIFIVDDCCPDETGKYVVENNRDSRVEVLFHKQNGGVGAAMKTGFEKAISQNFDIIVKMDGDDQMDSKYLESLLSPIIKGGYDYTKGNRFYHPETVFKMPLLRIIGNSFLSFMSKFSSGYYSVFDPTNGYIAIKRQALEQLQYQKLKSNYFFESDLLFRLNLIGAKVKDVPMPPIYNNEKSNLNEMKVIPLFLKSHLKNYLKRLSYSYFLREFSIGTVYLLFGVASLTFGSLWSLYFWINNAPAHIPTPTGTIMVGVLSVFIGVHSISSFLAYDVAREPK